ncbi:hypothetical protein FOA52_009404 [Chlamydomonas sp. UWO 241]|nr:hypothetical protein FOA52_009404 [Chlamydomonas sp. UWO 241]
MQATAKAKLIELFYWVTPEFNDDFVKAHKEFSEKFDSAEDMRKQLLAATAMTRVEEFDRQMEDSLWDEVVACVDVPEVGQGRRH